MSDGVILLQGTIFGVILVTIFVLHILPRLLKQNKRKDNKKQRLLGNCIDSNEEPYKSIITKHRLEYFKEKGGVE